MVKKVNDPHYESMTKQERIVNKVKNRDDALLKLRELFYIQGLDIDFNHENNTAILRQKGIDIPMEYNGNRGYFLKDGNKLIAFEFKEKSLNFNYGVKMEVVIADEDNSLKIATLIQEDSNIGNEEPLFSLTNYQNNELNKISINGHFIELSHGNVLDLKSAKILSSWNLNLPHKYKLGVGYTTLGFDISLKSKVIDISSERKYDYIPTVYIENIKKNHGTTKRTLINGNIANYQELSYTLMPTRFVNSSILPYSKYFNVHTVVAPSDRQFYCDDLAYQQAFLEILQSEEAVTSFQSVYNFFYKEPLAWFLEIYYGPLFRKIKHYQKGAGKNRETSPILEKK